MYIYRYYFSCDSDYDVDRAFAFPCPFAADAFAVDELEVLAAYWQPQASLLGALPACWDGQVSSSPR